MYYVLSVAPNHNYIWQILHRSFFLLSFNYLVFWRRCTNLHYCDRVTLSAFVSHQLWLISEHYLLLAVMVVSFHGILGFLTGCLGVSTGFGPSSMYNQIGGSRFKWSFLWFPQLFSVLTPYMMLIGVSLFGWLSATYGLPFHFVAILRVPSKATAYPITLSYTYTCKPQRKMRLSIGFQFHRVLTLY